MNRSIWSGLGALATVLTMAGCMSASVNAAGGAPLRILGGTQTSCPNMPASGPYPAYCNIRIQLSVSGNVCTATVLDSPANYSGTVNSSTDNRRPIVWQLLLPAGGSTNTFAFMATNGVLITAQSTLYPQVYGLQLGDGMGNANSTLYYHGWNKQNHVDSPAGSSYFPLVTMTDPSGNQSLCAAIDPKIVNN